MPTILVPLDGTPRATPALPVARTLARLTGGTIHAMHVAERRIPEDQLLEQVGLTREEIHGTVLDVETGSPAEAIVRAAHEYDDAIIVICSHTAADRPTGTLGHVAEAVLREATVPIVLVQPERGHRPWNVDHVLLPHDGTPTTAAGFAPSQTIARNADAELLVLHVAEARGGQPTEPGTFTVPPYIDQPQHEWPAWAAEFLDRIECRYELPPDLRLRLELATGEPGTEILRYARERGSDLIVLAWHGRDEADRAATLRTIIRDAPCPVLIYRAEEPSDEPC